MIYADQRWIGNHGIGRFARHVLAGFNYCPVSLTSNPASSFDAWRLSQSLAGLKRTDLFFSPGYNSPLFCAAPFILTVHDLNHLDRPENSSRSKRLYYTTILKRACHRSAHVFTVSEFSRNRIIDWAGVSPEKVLNVGCGVEPQYNPSAPQYSLPFPYIACVSNRKPHKNEFRTVQAFARAALPREMKLVFTGAPTAELVACIEHCQLNDRVEFTGLVSDEDLPSFYCSAEALVFVSLYEGFGLPVVEAMACGTPVVTANTSGLLETAGDASLLVDPTSVEQIAAALDTIITDKSLRVKLREKGREQAARFTWESTASKVINILAQYSTDSTLVEVYE